MYESPYYTRVCAATNLCKKYNSNNNWKFIPFLKNKHSLLQAEKLD